MAARADLGGRMVLCGRTGLGGDRRECAQHRARHPARLNDELSQPIGFGVQVQIEQAQCGE